VKGLFAKTLPGFGELFRRLSYEEIGTRTIGSRAIAGVVSATPVFCLPGSENAVRIGVDEVILPRSATSSGCGTDVEDAEEAGDDVEGEIGGNGTKEGDDVETDDTETDDAE